MASDRNRLLTERRRAGETYAALGKAFGRSRQRVREIVMRVEQQDARARELEAADRLSQQPNPLHLRPRLRALLAKACGKPEFTPEDVLALEHTEGMFRPIPNFGPRDWKELAGWMARVAKPPVQPGRKPAPDWLRPEADAAEFGVRPAQRLDQPGQGRSS